MCFVDIGGCWQKTTCCGGKSAERQDSEIAGDIFSRHCEEVQQVQPPHLVTQGQQEAWQDHHWVCLLPLEVRLHEAAQHRDELEGQPYQESQGRDFFKLLPLAGHLSNLNVLVLQVLKGHDDHVITCLQFSGNRIVSGSDDNTLKVGSFGNHEFFRISFANIR